MPPFSTSPEIYPPRLPLYGDGHHVWGLPARSQHVTHAVHKRPRAQHGGKVRAFADQIGLAHNAPGANTGHQGLAVHPAGNDPGRAVDQILQYVAHSNMTPFLMAAAPTSHDRRRDGGP